MSKALDDFMTGQIFIDEYRNLLHESEELKNELRHLLPEECKNPDNSIWNRRNFNFYKKYNFDHYKLVEELYKSNDKLGSNLNYFDEIEFVYKYLHPGISTTDLYHVEFILSLDICGDTYEGPEICGVVSKIVEECMQYKTKKDRLKHGRELRNKLFHTEDGKRPYWIQGAEWPMGKNSPMKYIKKVNKGELHLYYFQDVDTNEERVIEQFY